MKNRLQFWQIIALFSHNHPVWRSFFPCYQLHRAWYGWGQIRPLQNNDRLTHDMVWNQPIDAQLQYCNTTPVSRKTFVAWLCVSVLDSSLIDSPLSLLRFALSLLEGTIFFFFFSYRFCPFLDVAKSVDMFTHLNNDMLRNIKY